MFDSFFNRRDDESRIRQEGRLPPGQSLTNRFPVLHYGPTPKPNLESWNLRVFGEVEQERSWNWQEFNQLPRRKIKMDIHCVTRWSKFDTEWEGVHLQDLLEHGILRLKTSARYVIQHCEYNFTTNTPLEVALSDIFLLATHFDGAPLSLDHGFPLRVVVGALPGRKDLADPYFWKGGKWLRSLEFSANDKLGFWEQAGYHNAANVWKEQRFAYE
ncbi:MAG TPA: molybdopterin-dependent oxidoreductase [Anaerolineales bacterium]|nr:molybdopterin-dependent oxidoreductase [Anaerolineales bacterium]